MDTGCVPKLQGREWSRRPIKLGIDLVSMGRVYMGITYNMDVPTRSKGGNISYHVC